MSQPPTLPASLRLGPVHLTVADLDRSVAFYQDAIGLRQHRREDGVAAMGAGGEGVVVLVEEPGRGRPGRNAGMFHFALLYPSREELARALQRPALARPPIDGASDHGVSEAIYLPDADGNGIELYADRPREQWPPPGPGEGVGMFTRALDLDSLLDLVRREQPRRHAGEGLRVGHVHLHVGDLEQALGFYQGVLGFDLMTRYPGALFLSAGGYHHHVGVNTWRGEGVGPAPAGTVGLREWTIVHEEAEDGALRRDPWGIAVRLRRGS